jgi:hypothetical protein
MSAVENHQRENRKLFSCGELLVNKIQEMDMLIVETNKAQQEMMLELDTLKSSSKFLRIEKRMDTLSEKLSSSLIFWNKIND